MSASDTATSGAPDAAFGAEHRDPFAHAARGGRRGSLAVGRQIGPQLAIEQPAVCVADGFEELDAIAKWLQHVALRASDHRLLEKVDALFGRHHDHPAERDFAGDEPRGLDPIQVRHVDVHEHDVGLQLGRATDGFVSGRGRADHHHVGLGRDELTQHAAGHGAVVYHQDMDRTHAAASIVNSRTTLRKSALPSRPLGANTTFAVDAATTARSQSS